MEQSLKEFPLMQGKVIDMIAPSRKCRIVVRRGMENIILKLEDVLLFYTDNKVMYLLDRHRIKYMYDKNLTELEAILDPEQFFRVNRQYMLNINYIKSYKSFEKVKLVVEFIVPDIGHSVIISQETAPLFRKWVTGY